MHSSSSNGSNNNNIQRRLESPSVLYSLCDGSEGMSGNGTTVVRVAPPAIGGGASAEESAAAAAGAIAQLDAALAEGAAEAAASTKPDVPVAILMGCGC